jgi:hypothetical protein
MFTGSKNDSAAAQGSWRATEQASRIVRPGSGRWSAKRKMSIFLELCRGAELETTSRKYRVTAATLTEWRDRNHWTLWRTQPKRQLQKISHVELAR